ncbi:MAG: site-2 protease family protein [bacterium]|nr:site-2 protease family protein [bacterium]
MDILSFFPIIILIFSIVIHEVAHGAMAYWLGDATAKYAGRLTLNPIPHIDPIGSVVLPLILWATGSPIFFGWAKPVPYNPYNLRDQKYGPALVSIAGPGSNLLLALMFGILIRILVAYAPMSFAIANFIGLLSYIVLINIFLAVFNLVPIPPLDGSKILYALLPDSAYKIKMFLEQWGMFLLLIFIFYLSGIIMPIVQILYQLATGISF